MSSIKIIAFNLLLFAGLMIVLELGVRYSYRKRLGRIGTPIQIIYPPNPINGFQDAEFKREKPENIFKILCLGGSTSKWANYPRFIAWGFQGLPWIRERNWEVKVYSTGFEAHTSLDSYYKYKYLYDGYDFDLVIIYHGINELRTNNCPPEMFKADYSHYSYYRTVNSAVKLLDIPILRHSFLATKIVLSYQELLRRNTEARYPEGDAYVPKDEPNPTWMHFGSEIRSAVPFELNLEKIIQLAQERGQKVLIMTFASCFPADYKRSDFEAGLIPYGEGMDEGLPIELFGLPDNIRQGLMVHNNILRELAYKHRCYFIDQARLMDDYPEYFIDVCHFSKQGITAFAINIGRYFMQHQIPYP